MGVRSSTKRWWLWFTLGGLVLTCTYFAVPKPSVGYDAWYLSFGFLSVVAILVGVRINRPQSRLPWYLLAAGQLAGLGGDAGFFVASVTGNELPFPSLADIPYLAAYPLIAAGLALLIRRQCPGRDWASLADAAILTTGLSTVAWMLIMKPYASDSELGLLTKVVSMAYPAMDILILAVAARMVVGVSWRLLPIKLLAVGLVFQLGGDVLYGVGSLDGWYYSGHLIDLTWPVAYLAWGATALHPDMTRLTDPTPDEDRGAGRWRLAALAIATLLAPAMLALEAVRAQRYSMLVTVSACVVLFGLVIARLSGMVARNRQMARRELALRDGVAELVGAWTREDVAEVAARTALALTAHRAAWTAVELDARPGRLAGFAVPEGDADETAREGAASALTTEGAAVTRVPIEVPGRRHGSIGVCVPGDRLDRPEREAVATLALQTAMALEGIALNEDLLERQSSERFRALVQNSSDLIAVLDRDLKIRYHTPSVETSLGYEADALTGAAIGELLAGDDAEAWIRILAELSEHSGAVARTEVRLRHRDGYHRIAEVVASNLLDDANIGGIVVTAHDITDRKALEEQLGHRAFHDPLTGLANRTLFHERVTYALERAGHVRGSPTVLFLDLDDFKSVNDSLGHSAGDQLLQIVATRLCRRLRADDTIARLGGDEFGVLLDDAHPDDARRVALDVIAALAAPMDVMDTSIVTEVSIGIAVGRVGGTAEELLRDADAAMYRAKAAGKAGFAFFEQSMRAEATERLSLRTDLQHAIGTDQLLLHYQPIVDLIDGEVVSCEALARWNHPSRGIVSPLEFIPVAEETGLIVRLGDWLLRSACERAAKWYAAGPDSPAVSVNLSVRQLHEASLTQMVTRALTEAGLPPRKLILEITETVLMRRTPAMIASLEELRRLGVQVAIDDFGTGYSSLSYLQGFPVDILKIAKSFVDGVDQSEERNRLLGAIVRLGATLGLSVVAEGVELEFQADRLREFNCDLAQGFLFARPMDATSLEAWMSASPRAQAARTPVAAV